MNEITALRTPTAKTFLLGAEEDGRERRRLVVAPSPIHYERDGELVDIAPEWERTPDGWACRNVPYTLTVPTTGVGFRFECEDGAITGRVRGYDHATATPEGHRLWWLGAAPDLDLCLMALNDHAAIHHVLHSGTAPRVFVTDYDADEGMGVGETRNWGRDNINETAERRPVDRHRELEILFQHTREGRRITTRTEWTGRAKRGDPVTRIKAWTDDVAYPVRIR